MCVGTLISGLQPSFHNPAIFKLFLLESPLQIPVIASLHASISERHLTRVPPLICIPPPLLVRRIPAFFVTTTVPVSRGRRLHFFAHSLAFA